MNIKDIKHTLGQRWFLGLIGVIAVSIIVWFVGPLVMVAEYEPLKSDGQRLSVILVMFVVWAVLNLIKQQKQKKLETETIDTLLSVDDASDGVAAKEISVMRDRIESATQLLTHTPHGKRSIYDLPWYVLVGAPGSGKTTLLNNSGLDFPLKEALGNDPVSGIAGTKYCDWWFTDQAVFIDTAGRYTTQDSQAKSDSKAWFGFLGLLKKFRTRRPINGAIVTINLASLIQQTKTERSLQAKAIRSRLQELKNQLDMRFPIYVVLTKADMVAGFNEFFERLTEKERDSLFGFLFPTEVENSKGVITLFNKEFQHLLERLDERLLDRLDSEEDLAKRALIFEFPNQLRMLQAKVDELLGEVFSNNSFEESSMVRGVFLVSPTQSVDQQLPITAMSSTNAGLDRVQAYSNVKVSKSYFVKSLMEDVVFKEQWLGSINRGHQKQNKWLRVGALTVCTSLLVGSGALWFFSYQWNNQLITRTNQDSEMITSQLLVSEPDFSTDVIGVIDTLDRIKELPLGLGDVERGSSTVNTFGLYQGEKIEQGSHAAYQNALSTYLAPYLAQVLTDEIEQSENHREYLYETLKVYLMLFNEDKFEQQAVEHWFEFYWSRQFPGEANQGLRDDLMVHTSYLLSSRERGFAIDQPVVDEARNVLTQMSLSERAYQRMKLKFTKSHVPSFRITDVLGPKSLEQFERLSGKPLSQGISGFYTYNGFHSIFQIQLSRIVKSLMEENWVYGDDINAVSINQDVAIEGVKQRYFQDYTNEWKGLIEDIQLKSAPSITLAHHQAMVLSGVERPIESLIRAIQKEIELTKVTLSQNQKAASEVVGKVAEVKMSNTMDKLDMYLPSETSFDVALPGTEVESEFAEFLLIGDMEFDQIQTALINLRSYLGDLASAGNNQKLAYTSLLDGSLSQDVARSVNSLNSVLPAPFNSWLQDLSAESERFAESGSKEHLNKLWQTKVVKSYQRSISGRYPFVPSADKEVRLKDFKRFFGYGGTLDSFFNEYLEPFVDTSHRSWKFERDIGVSEETLKVFKQANRIRQAFFEDDNQLKVEFGMKPVFLDQHITRFALELGGQQLEYKHGPQKTKSLAWPARDNDTRIIFTPPNSAREIAHSYEGEWGIFKLLDQSLKARPESRKDNIVMIDLKGNKIKLELIPSSTINPFWSNEMERFRCPRTL